MSEIVEYNGYRFNEYSDCSVSAAMQDDDSQRTTLYHRYKLRVETTIYAEGADFGGQAGGHFARIRDRLTKKGQPLKISHGGFSDGLFEINVYDYGQRDVTFGPHPRVVTWEPVGYENAVHVVWECEFCVSACNRWAGIMAINYGINTRIDTAGYTTRTISGYLEIAMTRTGRSIPDTADAYRNSIIVGHMANFQRETTWNLSPDKRRADFTIVDTEIKSPNAYAPGVIRIDASHSANWSIAQSARLPQQIRATIELAQGQPRSRAWEIFRAIVNSRLAFAAPTERFYQSLSADESLYANTISFSVSYYTFVKPNEAIMQATGMFGGAGMFTPLGIASWQLWKTSVAGLQSHYGQARIQHDPTQDQIVDLCSTEFQPGGIVSNNVLPSYPMPLSSGSLYNQKPLPEKSYLKYHSATEYEEDTPTTQQVTVDEEDGEYATFNPSETQARLPLKVSGNAVTRFTETQAGKIYIWWRGYAERVGYPIPKPDKIEVDGVTFKRVTGRFNQQFVGNVLGQPVYRAAWVIKYVAIDRPQKLETNDIDDWEL